MIINVRRSLKVTGMIIDNFWLRFFYISTFSFFLASHSFAQFDDLIAEPYNSNSNITFNQLMENPYLRDTFLQMQRRLLLEPVDQQIHTFIENNQEIKRLLNMLTENFKAQLQSYVVSLVNSNTPIPIKPLTPNVKSPLTKKYIRIQKIVEDIARDFGYSEEAIKNRRLFVANGNGQVNAFTISPIQSEIVVVVNLELWDKMNESELRAVLAHEFGHIRAGHVANGILLRTLMNTTLRLVGPSGVGNQLVMSNDSHNHFVRYMNDQNLNAGSSQGLSVRDIESYIYQNRETLIPKFIDLSSKIFMMSPGYSNEARYFADLKEMVVHGSAVAINGEQLKKAFDVLNGVISRSQESSSDRFSSSQSHAENIAFSMLKLSGVPTEATKEELRALLKLTIEQTRKSNSSLSLEELRELNNSSHPVKGIRILTIMNFPKVPDMYFANPFMKLLLLENELTSGVQSLEKYIQSQKTALESLGRTSGNDKSPEGVSQVSESGDQQKAQERIGQLENIIQGIQLELNKLRQTIVAKVISMDLPQAREKGMSLLRNPRFENLLQFVTFNKLEMIQSVEKIENELGSLSNTKEGVAEEEKQRRLLKLNSDKQQLLGALNRFSFDLMSLLESQYQSLQKRAQSERGQPSLALEIPSQRLEKLRTAQIVLPLTSKEGSSVIGSLIHGSATKELFQLLELNNDISGKPGRSKMPSFMTSAGDPQIWRSMFDAGGANSSVIKSCKALFSAK